MPAKKPRKAWHVPDYTDDDIRAVQAVFNFANELELAEGQKYELTPIDARRFLDFLLNHACEIRGDAFLGSADGPEGSRDYLLGRQSVAKTILKLESLKPELFKK